MLPLGLSYKKRKRLNYWCKHSPELIAPVTHYYSMTGVVLYSCRGCGAAVELNYQDRLEARDSYEIATLLRKRFATIRRQRSKHTLTTVTEWS